MTTTTASERAFDHRLRNLLHSLLLLGAMAALLALIGDLFFGSAGVTLAVVAGAALLTLGRVSPYWVLRMQRARPLTPHGSPRLYRLVRSLARKAELRQAPDLYLVPSPAMNAFAVGNGEESAIGLTDALVRGLDERELAGVLAHEISHIRHRDLWVMGLAQMIRQMTGSLSFFGQLALLLAFPAMLVGGATVPWLGLLLLVAAPSLSGLLQLALSRTREFAADLGAARLTGDPLGLASALHKLDFQEGGWLRRLFFPARRRDEGSPLLRSHPATTERVARLRSLAEAPAPAATPRRAAVRPTVAEPLFRLAPRRLPIRVGRNGGLYRPRPVFRVPRRYYGW